MNVGANCRMRKFRRVWRNQHHIITRGNSLDELLDQNADASSQRERVFQTEGDFHLADENGLTQPREHDRRTKSGGQAWRRPLTPLTSSGRSRLSERHDTRIAQYYCVANAQLFGQIPIRSTPPSNTTAKKGARRSPSRQPPRKVAAIPLKRK